MSALHYFLPALIATSAHAAELTLEAKPFSVTHSLKASALPESVIAMRLDSKLWTTFEIVTIADHGRAVKKGDSLVVFKSDTIDRKIADAHQAIATAELELAQAELDLSTLEKTVPEQLKRLEKLAGVAEEELKYFLDTGRDSSKQSADQSLKRQRQLLASYQEELKQLLKMYEADDITEETEEIILQKQRDTVEYAEFALQMEILNHKRRISVTLPREEIALMEKRDDTALQFSKAKQDLPRSVELKKLELEKLKTTLKRQREELADLEHDRKLFEIKATENGWFYYGSVENGQWVTGEMVKTLVPRGVVAVGKNFACLIPNSAKLMIQASAQQADAAALDEKAKGFATLAGRDDVLIPITLTKLAGLPNPDGTYRTTFTAEWPKSLTPVPGQAMDVKVISYSNDQAVTVPSKAMEFGAKGWTIEMKLADGKTERRMVTRGKTAGELTEITSGAEVGQVVIVP
jgi:HlyD family secretion protein